MDTAASNPPMVGESLPPFVLCAPPPQEAKILIVRQCDRCFLDVARPRSWDPPPGDRLPGDLASLGRT
eukprot:1184207-Prorocentrum_minimum.AAC.2